MKYEFKETQMTLSRNIRRKKQVSDTEFIKTKYKRQATEGCSSNITSRSGRKNLLQESERFLVTSVSENPVKLMSLKHGKRRIE
jgi:hypothetical protein